MSFESRVVFFKSGLTNADLRSFGNIPVLSDRLIMWVTTETMTSTQYGRSLDGTGSERQVDFGELKIKFLISAIVTGTNEEKTGAGWSGKENGLTSISGRFARRDLILSVKNELNWWAESEDGGSAFDVELRCKTLSMECQRDFELEQLTNSEAK